MMEQGRKTVSLKGKKNVYQCDQCGGQIVTIDRDEGTTPFLLKCRATESCAGFMTSAFYRVPQDIEPTHQWIRLTEAEAALEHPAAHQHHRFGGLFLRPVDPPKEEPIDAKDDVAREMWRQAIASKVRPERMRYLGVLALLGECGPYVTDELRDQIEQAMIDACADGRLSYRRTLHRFDIAPMVQK